MDLVVLQAQALRQALQDQAPLFDLVVQSDRQIHRVLDLLFDRSALEVQIFPLVPRRNGNNY